MHLFLHQVFLQNKELSRAYHEQQISLYIRFDKDNLMPFLQQTDSYPPFKAAEACKEAGMSKEQAYLCFKNGKEAEAVRVLIDHCSEDIQTVIDLAVMFEVSDKQLWDAIIGKANKDNAKIAQLLQFMDVLS